MHFRFTSAVRSASTFALAALLTLAFSLTANAQYFKLSGSFTYHNIPSRPGYQVFDISPDGKMGVSYRGGRQPGTAPRAPSDAHLLTSTGKKMRNLRPQLN